MKRSDLIMSEDIIKSLLEDNKKLREELDRLKEQMYKARTESKIDENIDSVPNLDELIKNAINNTELSEDLKRKIDITVESILRYAKQSKI